MKKKAELIRKTWPKIRRVRVKGVSYFRVDARRKGTNGRQETFVDQQEAEDRAREIADEFGANGVEGLSFPAELRGMALAADKILAPYGKTVLQAAEFYRDHLEHLKKLIASATVSALASQWLHEKKSNRVKKLRAETIRGIEQASRLLNDVFGDRKVLEITTGDISKYIGGLDVGLRRKFNINSRFSQFFNYCVLHGHITKNPCDGHVVEVDTKDIAIFTPKEAFNLLKVCREKHPELVLYHAIGLFAGLRPRECQLLKWEHVHLTEKTITVLASTSKTKETRNVPIEATLGTWLEVIPETKRKGFVTNQTNLAKKLKAFHKDLGYKCDGENQDALPWPQDVMRHSYGSYWLALKRNRALLAENMGNSISMIKRHYKKVVSRQDCADFWKITESFDGEGEVTHTPNQQEIREAHAERLRKALAKG